MNKLLRANFSRLFRDKVFRISCVVMALAGAGLPLAHYLDKRNNGENWTADSTCFVFAFLAPILLSLTAALFVGSEYSDGTIRNKVIVGHRRPAIYLSAFVTCGAAGILLCGAYLLPHLCLGALLLGGFDAAAGEVLLYMGLNFALVLVFAALFTAIAMLCQNKAYSTSGCILLVFALLFAGVSITSALNEPEFYSGYSYSENGITITEEPERNPHYLSGTKRQVYEFLQDFVPGGQAIQLANMKAEKPGRLAVCDGVILLGAVGAGVWVFRRKDLK